MRLDAELDERIVRAARAEGSSVSEFIRDAARERADRVLSQRAGQALADVVGIVRAGGGAASRTGEAFTDLLATQAKKPRGRS